MLSIQTFEDEIKTAMKAKDQVKLSALRMLKTRLMNDKIALSRELTEADILASIQSEVKRRQESYDQYISGGRQDLADAEQAELKILKAFLPAQVSEEEIKAKISAIIQEQTGTPEFGVVMKALKAHFGASSDGATLSRILKETLK